MCLGVNKKKEHLSESEILQPCREAGEETGLDRRRPQDFDYSLSILQSGIPYKELGHDYLSRRKEDKIVKGHVKRLQEFGYEVELKKATA